MSWFPTVIILVSLPLIGGVVSYRSKNNTPQVSVLFSGASFLVSVLVLIQFDTTQHYRFEWLPGISVGMLLDRPAVMLLVLVSLISFLVHLFSMEYMKGDSGQKRYFLGLGFFTFSMLGLLVAADLILLFVFWELVGVASYLLIGFWFSKKDIPSSARLAFMVNRVADVALLSAILMLSAQEDNLFISDFNKTWAFLPSLLLSIGAFGKSAQLPFSGWLTKAMVGPIPVSALIHVATMVVAGVYLLFRVAPLLPLEVSILIAVVGAITALYGAISALVQHDIKKVLAYSTISQLGYMVMGIGVGAGESSLFHLWTHAFFKAGLFLGAGSIIRYLHRLSEAKESSFDSQDMRFMGGLKDRLPWTFRLFIICGLALAGVPFFTGFMSKEGIILTSWTWAENMGTWAYLIPSLALITLPITAFYVGRMILLIFWGESWFGELLEDVKYTENVAIRIPLIILALGSLWLFYQWDNPLSYVSPLNVMFGNPVAIEDAFIRTAVPSIAILFSVGGLLLAYFFFNPSSNLSRSYVEMKAPVSFAGKIMLNGFFITRFYQYIGHRFYFISKKFTWIDVNLLDTAVHFIAVTVVVLSKLLALVDRFIFDGMVNFSAWSVSIIGKLFSSAHSRQVQWQLIWLLIAFILILSWILLL